MGGVSTLMLSKAAAENSSVGSLSAGCFGAVGGFFFLKSKQECCFVMFDIFVTPWPPEGALEMGTLKRGGFCGEVCNAQACLVGNCQAEVAAGHLEPTL